MKKIAKTITTLISKLAFPAALTLLVAIFSYFYSISDHNPIRVSHPEYKLKQQSVDQIEARDKKISDPKTPIKAVITFDSKIRKNIKKDMDKMESRSVTINPAIKTQQLDSKKEFKNKHTINKIPDKEAYSKEINNLLKIGTPIHIEMLK